MEIRNALIMLTKISGVFPVTRKTGINLEKRASTSLLASLLLLISVISICPCVFFVKRLMFPLFGGLVSQVAKIKNDEREDLKVLATGVAAALSARKVSANNSNFMVSVLCNFTECRFFLQPHWVTDEEFSMGFLELKAPPVHTPKHASSQNGLLVGVSQGEPTGERATVNQQPESDGLGKDQISRTKPLDGRTESIPSKSDQGHLKSKAGNPLDAQPSMSKKSMEQKETDETPRLSDENPVKAASKYSEAEVWPCSFSLLFVKLPIPAFYMKLKFVTSMCSQKLCRKFILPILSYLFGRPNSTFLSILFSKGLI